MKKFFFLLMMFFSLGSLNGFSQANQDEWVKMITKCNNSVNEILISELPQGIALDSFKRAVINGNLSLSKLAKDNLQKSIDPLTVYGKEVASRLNLEISSDDASNEYLVASMISPNGSIDNEGVIDLGLTTSSDINARIDWGEVLECAATAVGIDMAWAFGQSTASSWSWSTIKKVFKTAVPKVLGPVGVGLAVASFLWCIW